MDNVGASTQQIDDALIATWGPMGQPAGMARDLATSLHYLLTKYTTSGANQFVDNIPNQNGLVTWHALSARFKLPGVQVAIMALTQVMNTKFTDKYFEVKFPLWETEILKYEQAINEILPETVRLAVLLGGTQGDTH